MRPASACRKSRSLRRRLLRVRPHTPQLQPVITHPFRSRFPPTESSSKLTPLFSSAPRPSHYHPLAHRLLTPCSRGRYVPLPCGCETEHQSPHPNRRSSPPSAPRPTPHQTRGRSRSSSPRAIRSPPTATPTTTPPRSAPWSGTSLNNITHYMKTCIYYNTRTRM